MILSKIYTRERALFDFFFWDEADRHGIKKYLAEDLKGDLRIVGPLGRPGEVWYSDAEIERLALLAAEAAERTVFTDGILADADSSWKIIEPYVKQGKKLSEVAEMLSYYDALVVFWAAFNTVFFELPNRPGINEYYRSSILRLREQTQEYTELMSIRFVEYIRSHFPEIGDYAWHASPHDVAAYSKGDASIAAILKDRSENGCLILDGSIYPRRELDAELNKRGLELENLVTEGANEVKGAPAFKGKASGRVRIVFTMADAQGMEEGEILISPMTIPDYVPYIRKASAVVTDEGGIICHAAIIARELQKPCVIGTRIATQIFKNGDMVEVDAENGIVRKI